MRKRTELSSALAARETRLDEIDAKLGKNISADSRRALLQTKNELVGEIQALKIEMQSAPPKSFEQSLNETYEL